MHRFLAISAIFAVVVALTPAVAQQAGDSGPSPWRQWRGVGPWPIGPGMMGGGMMGASPRHPYAMMSGIPEAYSHSVSVAQASCGVPALAIAR